MNLRRRYSDPYSVQCRGVMVQAGLCLVRVFKETEIDYVQVDSCELRSAEGNQQDHHVRPGRAGEHQY